MLLALAIGVVRVIVPAAPTFSPVVCPALVMEPPVTPPLAVLTDIEPPVPVVMSRSAALPVPITLLTEMATAPMVALVVIELPAAMVKSLAPALPWLAPRVTVPMPVPLVSIAPLHVMPCCAVALRVPPAVVMAPRLAGVFALMMALPPNVERLPAPLKLTLPVAALSVTPRELPPPDPLIASWMEMLPFARRLSVLAPPAELVIVAPGLTVILPAWIPNALVVVTMTLVPPFNKALMSV